jgi:hypothetical protein
MTDRPTAHWRDEVRKEAEAVAAGTLDPGKAYSADLWPDEFIAEVDRVLDEYEAEVGELSAPGDDAVLGTVERAVLALNEVNEEHEGIETGEREELAEYLDTVLTRSGIDTAALMARQGRDRGELTDQWRDW